MSNIVMIGMPGCGKSTVGVLLAKVLGKAFIDTDVVLQANERRKLQQIIDEIGIDAFLALEEEAVVQLKCENSVIATGGSVIYGKRAMKALHDSGTVVYIRLPYEEIEKRLSNLATRGVTLRSGQTLYDLYLERVALYEQEADIIIDAFGFDIEKTVSVIASHFEELNGVRHGSWNLGSL